MKLQKDNTWLEKILAAEDWPGYQGTLWSLPVLLKKISEIVWLLVDDYLAQ
jgi:hypothetical protein